MKRVLLFALAGVVAFSALGCRTRVSMRRPVATVTVSQPPPPPVASGNLTVTVQTPGVGITSIDSYCNPGAAEACNGLDDNCNGVIDEGCGFSTGNIQVTLAWATGADLDMYVTDPLGYTISYQNRQSPSGGHLDHDARGACNRRQEGNTIENVYFDSAQPPSGQYRVEVHYWGNCGVAGTTQGTLSIAVGGQIIGAYNVVLNPGDRQPVAIFNMP
jgi:tRNA (guanosine-2'-O-)-methyltransferase